MYVYWESLKLLSRSLDMLGVGMAKIADDKRYNFTFSGYTYWDRNEKASLTEEKRQWWLDMAKYYDGKPKEAFKDGFPYGLSEVTKEEYPVLYQALKEMAEELGEPMPNIFTYTRVDHYFGKAVCMINSRSFIFQEDFVRNSDEQEIKWTVGHEFSHFFGQGDLVARGGLITNPNMNLLMLVSVASYSLVGDANIQNLSGLAFLFGLFTAVGRSLIYKSEEYIADAFGAMSLKKGEAIHALGSHSSAVEEGFDYIYPQIDGQPVQRSQGEVVGGVDIDFIETPLNLLCTTHPRTKNRLLAIEKGAFIDIDKERMEKIKARNEADSSQSR